MSDLPLMLFRYPDISAFPFEIFRIEYNASLTQKPQHIRRDAFYVVYWITAGSGIYYVDFERYDIRPNTLFFISPGQVHYWEWEDQAPIKGYAMPFKAELFNLYGLHDFLYELDLFDMIDSSTAINLSDQDAGNVQQIVAQLCTEYEADKFGRQALILSLLQILLILAQRQLTTSKPGSIHTAGQKLSRDYLHLLKENVIVDHNLDSYAKKLGVTAGYLSETIKDETGLPAGKVLRQRLALEAKRLLVRNDLTVVQIAEKLNFTDPSNFGRFFKRETGYTPLGFRQSFQIISGIKT
jgi:AraC-like DNA-binding protein